MAIITATSTSNRPLNCTDVELSVASYFDFRRNLIVPNIWWGLDFDHEIDVLVLTPANYAYEIEIKVSASDLRKDFQKPHGHASNRLRKQFFAVPTSLRDLATKLILKQRPRWGLIVVDAVNPTELVQRAEANLNALRFTEKERQHLYDLASLRIWTLKRALAERREKKLIEVPK